LLELKFTLKELEVTGNPLVVPSYTSFQMGGLAQAFRLLEEHEQASRRAQEELSKIPALMPSSDAQAILDAEDAGQRFINDAVMKPGQHGLELTDDHHSAGDYFFAHCKGTADHTREEQIREIRNAESTILIIKRNMYFQSQKVMAKKAYDSAGQNKSSVPKTLQKFLDDDYDISKWNGIARVTDLDLYFNLLVYSTKPQYSTCATLFDRFEMDDKGYLDKSEWNEFLLFSPIELSNPEINDDMWRLMSWRSPDRITLTDFVAAWHIHDVENPDPWIQRLTKVLRLDYYEMPLEELQARLRAKDAEDATPELDLDKGDSSDDEADDEMSKIRLPRTEGERWVLPPTTEKTKGPEGGKDKQADHRLRIKNSEKNVGMDDKEYSLYENAVSEAHKGDDQQSESDQSDMTMNSAELSDSSDSDVESDFDMETKLQGASLLGPSTLGNFQVTDQASMDQLMLLNPKNFFKQKPKQPIVPAKASQTRTETKGKEKASKAKVMGGGRFKTDVFSVRQEIRKVYRNLPYDDFAKMVSFLLRGMQMIKHARERGNGIWHADDPTFKFTMGATCTNLYTRRLLRDMGFAIVDNLYWVWPDVHMKEAERLASRNVPIWGDDEIPRDCAGRNKDRLKDMIDLFTSCQRSLHKHKEKFNGSFR
jgi:hypothetical protein